MTVHTLEREQELDGTPEEVFPFFADAWNLEAITPPLLAFKVTTERPIAMFAGALIEYRLKIHRMPIRWKTLIEQWQPSELFVDTQIKGPYKLWHHTHTFEPLPGERTLMRDIVRYSIGYGPAGDIAHKLFVGRDVESIFEYRAEVLAPLLAADIEARAAAA
ncbi:MAG: CDP-paratose 2-epimerase [Actinobacteria bacterium]|uniref:Unannotated protein n=1 Tax=freshwater metagenome TaxID=449393 RepID=A0A6J5Z635_9ZZZZ|nr:CDP-paratose 2-epimerase [Actinomycetota bacterium]